MAGRAMNVRILSRSGLAGVALALALSLSACGHDGGSAEPPPLAGAALGGPFHLVDQNGKAVTERDFAGKYRTVYFGYSFCPDVCPTDLQTLMQGYRAFAAKSPALAAKLVPIFVTVDPARDTPAVLKQYVSAFGPQLVGLTGTDAEIASAAKEYGAFYKKQPAPAGASGYLMDHSRQTILFDPDGKPLALVPTDQNSEAVAASLAQWVHG
jgi:protein SCO1